MIETLGGNKEAEKLVDKEERRGGERQSNDEMAPNVLNALVGWLVGWLAGWCRCILQFAFCSMIRPACSTANLIDCPLESILSLSLSLYLVSHWVN